MSDITDTHTLCLYFSKDIDNSMDVDAKITQCIERTMDFYSEIFQKKNLDFYVTVPKRLEKEDGQLYYQGFCYVWFTDIEVWNVFSKITFDDEFSFNQNKYSINKKEDNKGLDPEEDSDNASSEEIIKRDSKKLADETDNWGDIDAEVPDNNATFNAPHKSLPDSDKIRFIDDEKFINGNVSCRGNLPRNGIEHILVCEVKKGENYKLTDLFKQRKINPSNNLSQDTTRPEEDLDNRIQIEDMFGRFFVTKDIPENNIVLTHRYILLIFNELSNDALFAVQMLWIYKVKNPRFGMKGEKKDIMLNFRHATSRIHDSYLKDLARVREPRESREPKEYNKQNSRGNYKINPSVNHPVNRHVNERKSYQNNGRKITTHFSESFHPKKNIGYQPKSQNNNYPSNPTNYQPKTDNFRQRNNTTFDPEKVSYAASVRGRYQDD